MPNDRSAVLAEMEATLSAALKVADTLGETLLAAKLDDALICLQEIADRQDSRLEVSPLGRKPPNA